MSKRSRRNKKTKRHSEAKPQQNQKKQPVEVSRSHVANWLAPILGAGALGALFLGLGHYSSSPQILYSLPAAVTMLLLAVTLVVPGRYQKRAAIATLLVFFIVFPVTRKFIQTAQQTMELASQQGPTFRPGVERVDLTFGSNDFVYDVSQLQKAGGHPLMLGGLAPITLYIENDKLYADVALYDGPGLAAVEVKHNSFIVRPPGWDANSDNSALEVVDSQLRPVFQMSYTSPQHTIINGYFAYPGGFVVATDAGMTINPTGPVPALTRIFRYPSWKYPSQRSQ